MSAIYDVYKIGIGPSSSHTVGPMRAARAFLRLCLPHLQVLYRVQVDLYGSLALTGIGHATDRAIILGLLDELPDKVKISSIEPIINHVKKTKKINFAAKKEIDFDKETDIIFHYRKALPQHANGMRFWAFDISNKTIVKESYFSIGGGLIKDSKSIAHDTTSVNPVANSQTRFNYESAEQLLQLCKDDNCSISELMWRNEELLNQQRKTTDYLTAIWRTMNESIDAGINAKQSLLLGGLNVERRAPSLYKRLCKSKENPSSMLDWVSMFALAVNEENAAGNRVVTAPTNGSAGVVPASMRYLKHYYPEKFDDKKALNFLMTSGAIGLLYQKCASISAAEMGCQGEIGVSSSMAAAGICEFLGGDTLQVANAAEIAMEHHLGLTCDPVKGLVQIPCIERNAMGAVKAINAAKLALVRNNQRVSLDQVIKTMYQTGKDMSSNYKETSLGGLAANVITEEDGNISTVPYRLSKNQVAC